MNTIKDTIVDLCYLNYTTEQIVNYLVFNKVSNQDKTELYELVSKTIKEHQEELDADAYLGSLECYYDNYCEY